EIRRPHERANLASRAVCIIHPARTADELAAVTEQLRDALEGEDFTVVGVLAVPRAVHNDKWYLQDTLVLPREAAHAVILDAGTSTGRTIEQLMDFAATEHIGAITGIVLLNGLDDTDAVRLQHIARVRRSRGMGDLGSNAA